MTSQPEPMLSLRNVHAVYDDIIVALRGVSLEVAKGSVVALLGANGAGKTSTLKAASGLLAAERGRVTLGSVLYHGRDSTRSEPRELVKAGLSLVLEGRHCFPHFSVEENLIAGALVRRPSRSELARKLERVYQQFPRLKARRKSLAGFTSGGEQQMLAMGRALLSRPTMLLLDEPSMGLAPIMVQKIFDTVRTIAAEGVTILLIEQNAKLALETANRGYVMESGEITLQGEARALLNDPKVRQAYLGEG